MRATPIPSVLPLLVLFVAGCSATDPSSPAGAGPAPAQPKWAVSIDNIEACSCPAFCQCYFTGKPALHEGHENGMRFCRFNNAFKITHGTYGSTNLDGMKIWMAGDLGGDFSKGQMDWAVVRFESSATPEQREAAIAVIHHIFPVKWNSFTTGADAKIDWDKTADGAWAKLNDGKSAEVALKPSLGNDGKPVVIQNLKFWAASKNSGFWVMPSTIEAYRDGDKPFEYKQSNGFFTTVEMSSDDVKTEPHAAAPSRMQMNTTETEAACCVAGKR